jgi:hypothetical protein
LAAQTGKSKGKMTMEWSRRYLLAALAGMPLAALARRGLAALRPRPNAHSARTVSAIVDQLIPAGDLPGAVALGIDQRILADTQLSQSLAAGVAWLDAYARRARAADFLRLDEAGQMAALTAGWAAQDSAVEQLLSTLWYRCATLYYSEAVVQQSYAYAGPPQPVGFADFQRAPR